MMDAVNEPGVREIVFKTSAQVGKTEIINNIVAYFAHQDPAPMLIIQPSLDMAEAWSKDRLSPMIRDTDVLHDLFGDPRTRDSGNTLLHKKFPGGHVTMAGANSPSSLASRPVRIVLLDEEDRYPASAGTEGDPGSLAEKRTTTFWNRLLVVASTPTVKGFSKIDSRYERSDRRKYFVPCPHCDTYQTLKWANIRWEERKAETAHYVCESCGSILTDADKPTMLAKGEWRAEEPQTSIIGFHISELYSPWVTWPEMVAKFLDAKRFPETLKVWINTSLGETWEEEGEGVDHESLLARKENWGKQLPEGVVAITAGVDVQDDRLEAEVIGWGEDEESWSLQYHVIHGDPGQKQVWEDLDKVLEQRFRHPTGVTLQVGCACVDSAGHHTQAVYGYVKKRQMKRIFAIKGASQTGKPIVGKWSRNNALKVKLFPIGTDTAKEAVYSRLKLTEPGAGYCHFPSHYSEDYFRQLTAERMVTRFVKGFPKRVWEKPAGRRNEALDCRVYGLAALYILNPDLKALASDLERQAMQINDKPKTPTRESGWIGVQDWSFN